MSATTKKAATVEIRDLFGEVRPLAPFVGVEWRDPYMIEIPAFGVLIIGSLRADESQWRALLIQPDDENRIGPASNHVPYDVTVKDDGVLEVELLPNVSGEDRLEDRLVVVVRPAVARLEAAGLIVSGWTTDPTPRRWYRSAASERKALSEP